MFSRRFRRRRTNDGGDADEAVAYINLSDSGRARQCAPEFVEGLSERVMGPALRELDGRFGGQWARDIEPWLVLEGPALTYKITIVRLPGWELMEMSTVVAEVFNRYWEREVDRVQPD